MKHPTDMKYQKILLKISGEALGDQLDSAHITPLIEQITQFCAHGGQMAIVMGGGNFWRGATQGHISRHISDQMGMLATVMNGLALSDLLSHAGVPVYLSASVGIPGVCDVFHAMKVRDGMRKGQVALIAGGTGHAYFTTDTACVLRALELACDCVVKATKVDGVYSGNPMTDPSAHFYPQISYQEALDQRLEIMDQTAFTLAKENALPIIVGRMETVLQTIVTGEGRCTTVS